jgi:hypothetical protein
MPATSARRLIMFAGRLPAQIYFSGRRNFLPVFAYNIGEGEVLPIPLFYIFSRLRDGLNLQLESIFLSTQRICLFL